MTRAFCHIFGRVAGAATAFIITSAAGAASLDGAYCSTDPAYAFRMDAKSFVDAGGKCRAISTDLDPEGALIIKQDCPAGVLTITVQEMYDTALIATFDGGNQYHLARCP